MLKEVGGRAETENQIVVIETAGETALQIPGGGWLLSAQFVRQGGDLLLVGKDGGQILVRGFFTAQNPPDLMTSNGAKINADLAIKLAGPLAPGQVVQAGATDVAEPIGKVVTATGTVEVAYS